MPTTTPDPTTSPPRPGARVVLLDPHQRVLLLHATDPTDPTQRWWELPGGGLQPEEDTVAALLREVFEETGIRLDPSAVGPCVWVRESRFRYRGQAHHRIDWIHPAWVPGQLARAATSLTRNERASLLQERWWTLPELQQAAARNERILPPALPTLVPSILAGDYPQGPIELTD